MTKGQKDKLPQLVQYRDSNASQYIQQKKEKLCETPSWAVGYMNKQSLLKLIISKRSRLCNPLNGLQKNHDELQD